MMLPPADGKLRIASRLRIGVTIEQGLDSRSAGPEAATTHLMRICTARHPVRNGLNLSIIERQQQQMMDEIEVDPQKAFAMEHHGLVDPLLWDRGASTMNLEL